MAPITRFYLYMVDAYYGNCAAEDDLEAAWSKMLKPPLCVSAGQKSVHVSVSSHLYTAFVARHLRRSCAARQPDSFPVQLWSFEAALIGGKLEMFCWWTCLQSGSYLHIRQTWKSAFACLGSCFWLHDWWKWWGLGSVVQCASSH